MNIRLSPDLIRIRLSQTEATELSGMSSISETFFLDTEYSVKLQVSLHDENSMKWRIHHAPKNEFAIWNCYIPQDGFRVLLNGTLKKDASITTEIQLSGGERLTIVIEVDIWDEEKRSKAKR